LLGIPLLAGREFTWSDGQQAQSVSVVSESLARALSPDGNVLGRSLTVRTLPLDQDSIVVGVVADATQGDPRNTRPHLIYRPVLQLPPSSSIAPKVLIQATDVATVTTSVRQVLAGTGQF